MFFSAYCTVCGNSFSFVLNFPQEVHQKFCPKCLARYPLLSLYPAPFTEVHVKPQTQVQVQQQVQQQVPLRELGQSSAREHPSPRVPSETPSQSPEPPSR